MPAVRIRDLTVEYDSGGYRVRPIDAFDLDIASGELVLLLGPSGCGKSTLLSVLGALLAPRAGTIRVDDEPITGLDDAGRARYRRDKVGIVFQAFNLVPSLSARENVAAPAFLTGTPRREAMRKADRLLEQVGLADRGHHKPGHLSGGQQQRVAIARALINDPPLLLADEPTANLDHIQAESVIALLRSLAGQGRTIVISTHDSRVVPIADRVVEMGQAIRSDGRAPEVLTFDAGASIFEQGTRGDRVYVVQSGEVDIVRLLADGGEEPLATIEADGYFGELGPLLGFPRSASARARSDVELLSLALTDFRERVDSGSLRGTGGRGATS